MTDEPGDRLPATTLGAGGPVVSHIGLGLAAVGRPAYITTGRDTDLPDRSIEALRRRTFELLDAAAGAGVRYVDAARSYGRAEEFLGAWLRERGAAGVVVGSKWGYRYTGAWRLDVQPQEVKEHSLAMFRTQLAESRDLLGDRLVLYQVHSLTLESTLFDDRGLLAALADLAAHGVRVGLTTSGAEQAATLRRALAVQVGGRALFSSAQVTWNLLERSVAGAAQEAASAGWAVIVKEALANGRLSGAGDAGRPGGALDRLAHAHGSTPDAVALAAALVQPWASVVLSGAVTTGQLAANLAAVAPGAVTATATATAAVGAEQAAAYWAARGRRPWD